MSGIVAGVALRRAPLRPAGRLPRKGGDQTAASFTPIPSVAEKAKRPKPLPSPLAGETAGRPERGATERYPGKSDGERHT